VSRAGRFYKPLENNGTNRNTRDMKTIFDRFRFSLTIKVLVVEATAGIEPACTDLQSTRI